LNTTFAAGDFSECFMKLRLLVILLAMLALAEGAIYAQTNVGGSVKGRLLQATGRPLPYIEMEMVPVDAPKIVVDQRLIAVSDTTGNFFFPNIPEGLYTMSVNFGEPPTDLSPFETFFYPAAVERAQAKVFEITTGSRFTGITFRLPAPLARRNITGQTVFSDGRPAASAWLAIRDLAVETVIYRSFGEIRTDKNGNFSAPGFAGRRYQIAAILFENPAGPFLQRPNPITAAGETPVFTLGATAQNLSLVMKTQKDYKWVREKYVAQIALEKREGL
jgi:hypothetical protein